MKPLSYFEISREALEHNARQLRKYVDRSKQIIAVVKANAYGHGFEPVVTCLEKHVGGFQVDDIEELRAVRALTEKPILVLGYVQEFDLAEAVALGAELALYDTERLALLEMLGIPVRVHLKIDALLGRQGLLPHQLDDFLSLLKSCKHVTLAGVYSHFSHIKETTSLDHSHAQMAAYEDAVRVVRSYGFTYFAEHLSATTAALFFEHQETSRHLVRLGISLYGMYPTRQIENQHASIPLQPALRWVSHLAQVKDLPQGHPVGYSATYVAQRAMLMGVVPQGYSDGLDHRLSNKGFVLVSGVRCPIIGRVSMNMCAVDLSNAPDACAGDEVVLLGRQGNEEISAIEMAEWCDSINHEVLTGLSPLIPRILV
jgi:alanine racemase